MITTKITKFILALVLIIPFHVTNVIQADEMITSTDPEIMDVSDTITGDQYVNDTVFYITSNITVENGGRLEFNNSTIFFNCSYDGAITIHVKAGGSILINDSYLTLNKTGDFSNNYGYNYLVDVEYRGKIKIFDSNITYAGFDDHEKSGIHVICDNPKFINTTFYGCYNGLYLNSDADIIDNVHVENCTFIDLERNGIQFPGPKDYYHTKKAFLRNARA